MKILLICQHFSTGGMPAYALKISEHFEKDGNDVKFVEVLNYSDEYVTHRKQLKSLIQLEGDQSKLIPLLKEESPDVIYFQEIPDSYLETPILNYIYGTKAWKIWVTTHSSRSSKRDFVYIPDKIIAVNKWQQNFFKKSDLYNTEIDLWEYPIEPKTPDKLKAKMVLGMTGYNVLNIGLFTAGKNQGELFEVARKNNDKTYHFVGNQAINFKDYWGPLMENKPDNCIIWGERKDTDLFYQACDEFYFTSKFELCPLVLKEALSWGLPVKMYKLPSYGTDYDNNPLVTYLDTISNYERLKQVAIQEIEVENIYEKYFQIEDGDVVVDVGAHIGIFTKKALNKASMVFALEPDPLFIEELRKLKTDKLSILKFGITDKTGISKITSDGNPNSVGEGDVTINTLSFKDFIDLKDIKKIDFLKLDCEGGEYHIFTKDNIPWLAENVKKIAGELHIHTDEQRAYIPYMLLLLRKAGFNIKLTSVDGYDIEDLSSKLDYYKEVLFYITKDQIMKPVLKIFYVDGCYVELKDFPQKTYNVKFIHGDTNEVLYQVDIQNNNWAKCSFQYFIPWKIKITAENFEYEVDLDLYNARVFISLESKSLGDTLAWFPYVEEFRKKHKCKVIVSTFLNELFEKTYPELIFVKPGERVDDIVAHYRIGWFYDGDSINRFKNIKDPKKQPLQKTAADTLGLEYVEIKPKLDLPEATIIEKTVTLGIHATTQAKYWNNPEGWQNVADYINSINYTPLIVSIEKSGYMGNIHPTGVNFNKPDTLNALIKTLCSSELFIGVGSGLSWLAWACNVPVILISGFSEDYTEIKDCYRVSSKENVCKGCFNTHKLDPSDWNWCPLHKGTDRQYECSKTISSDKIIQIIKNIIKS